MATGTSAKLQAIPPDIEIAQQAKMKHISEIAKEIGIEEEEIEYYGKYKAKISLDVLKRLADKPNGKLINVTAITPTNAGEGKTCTSIGLTQAFGKIGKKVMLCLREPSLGPVFGIKGGAAGGGYAQVLPMEDINLHFTGDIHAVGSAHNLLAALVDNHIIKGNELGIDPTRVTWRRAIDISDRQLRNVIVGLGGKTHGIPRETGFDITVASEVMAILALADGITDLKERLGNIMVGFTYKSKPVFAKDLGIVGSLALLLKDAIKPNLVQTLEGQPVFIHAGPFANIAHGNNSIIATKTALKLADYVVTESGFGADLGTEKFFDIVCRQGDLKPDLVVLVVSMRALKLHGGITDLAKTSEENTEAVQKGLANLDRHVSNIKKFGLPSVVAINRFYTDTDAELNLVLNHCEHIGSKAVISEVVLRGGEGGVDLASTVLEMMEKHPSNFKPLYDLNLPIKDKINTVATEIYGADGVNYTAQAEKDILNLTRQGFGKLPLCMARTQLSFTDDPEIKGAPVGWKLNVRGVRVSSGAGFLVPLTGEMMLMPGLPKLPAAAKIDIDENGRIEGLF